MRCPKCQYISFERGERCRNCGYEFSLAVDVADPELPLRGAEDDQPIGPLADLALGAGPSTQLGAGRFEMPLFGGAGAASTPPPRAPLAVRRSAAPDAPPKRVATLERPRRTLESDVDGAEEAGLFGRPEPAPTPAAGVAGSRPAGALRRLAAGVIDAAILLSIDLTVLYFTLRLCGLGFGEALIIPPVPFVGFLVLLNGGYASALTAASGQTIGKMAAGIKVVGAPGSAAAEDRIGFGFAVLRTAAYVASALPVGAGFLPALIGRDRRALHDRLAETRVIRISGDRAIV